MPHRSLPLALPLALPLTSSVLILSLGLAGCTAANERPSTQTLAAEERQPASSPDQGCQAADRDRSYVEPCVSVSSRDPNTPVRDIPGSTQVINRQLIEDQRALTVGDALRNVSGVQGR